MWATAFNSRASPPGPLHRQHHERFGPPERRAPWPADRSPDAGVAVADARKAERARIKQIMTSEESKGRIDLAAHLAFETEQPADAAIALLKAAPKAEGKGAMARAMDALGTPGIRQTDAPAPEKKLAVIDHTAIYGRLNAPQQPAAVAK